MCFGVTVGRAQCMAAALWGRLGDERSGNLQGARRSSSGLQPIQQVDEKSCVSCVARLPWVDGLFCAGCSGPACNLKWSGQR